MINKKYQKCFGKSFRNCRDDGLKKVQGQGRNMMCLRATIRSTASYSIQICNLFRHTQYVNNTEDYKHYAGTSESGHGVSLAIHASCNPHTFCCHIREPGDEARIWSACVLLLIGAAELQYTTVNALFVLELFSQCGLCQLLCVIGPYGWLVT